MRAPRVLGIVAALVVVRPAWGDAPAVPPPAADSPGEGRTAPDRLFGDGLRTYQTALRARHLNDEQLGRDDVAARVAQAESLMAAGRVDEAIARLVAVVEHPGFAAFADTEAGRAAVFRLGDALAIAGVAAPARQYLRRLVDAQGAFVGYGSAQVWARRAVRRLVDIALDTERYADGARDLQAVPATAPEEVRGEIAYMNGRARDAAGARDEALAAYAAVPPRSRFWAQAVYLSGLLEMERGNLRRAEELLCRVADPKRTGRTTPVFADEKFFAVRDLARLGLGRIAHEEGRNDDARYYYYLVPQDSDRLAEALYEAATTRYEKKDYDGARRLLDELAALGVHHRYEDEAWVLGAWIDLARCHFGEADKRLVDFLARYEPVRDAARRIAGSDAAVLRLLAAIHAGVDAGGAEIGGATPDVVRTIAALVRVDPEYGRVLRQIAVLDREASGLVNARAALGDMSRALATNGGVRPVVEEEAESGEAAKQVSAERKARDALSGVEQEIAALQAAHAPADRVAPLRQELDQIRARWPSRAGTTAPSSDGTMRVGADLADLLRADEDEASAMERRIAAARAALTDAERSIAEDALHRLDLRLSRLLRRARLGRIESVLGRKRALEVEVDAIRLGYLPRDAVDSMDAARYLEDNEEYWPFEGDDWPDEYVGSEGR